MSAKPDAAAQSLEYYRREAQKPANTPAQSVLDQVFGYYAA